PIADDQIPNIWNPSEGISEDKDGIPPMYTIDQEEERADQAEPPKRIRNDDFFGLFGGPPLHEKAREKDHVADPSHGFPGSPLDPEKLVVDEYQRFKA